MKNIEMRELSENAFGVIAEVLWLEEPVKVEAALGNVVILPEEKYEKMLMPEEKADTGDGKIRTVALEVDEDLYLDWHDAAVRNGFHGDTKAFILAAAKREAARRETDVRIMIQASFCRAAYVAGRMLTEEEWEDGGWYEWIDVYGKTGKARIKRDMADDHFYPNPDGMREEDIMGFRPIE